MSFYYRSIVFLVVLVSPICLAQKNTSAQKKEGFQITIVASNLKNQKLELYLANGSNKKQFVTDSIRINENEQTVNILQTKKIINAIYYLRFKNQKTGIALAIDNGTEIKLKIASTNLDEITCVENPTNIDFLAYQKQEKNTNIEQKVALQNKLKKSYPNSILNLYLTVETKISENTPTDLAEKTKYRNTFFNFIDRTDKRLIFLPNLTKLLYKYVSILPITSENYIENIDYLLKGIDCKTKGYPVFVNYFISNLAYFESNQLEKAFNHLFSTYIDKNPCDVFSDVDYNAYSNKYATNKKVPIGSNTPDFELVSKDSIAYKLSEVYPKNDFTFVAFYSPTCKHCQDKMPVVSDSFKNLKNKYPNKNIQLVGILNDPDESSWEAFISEKRLTDWLNLKSIDPKRKYQEDFNSYSNPSFFLISNSGEILLKTFNIKAIEELIKK